MSELECHIVSVEDALAKEMKTHDKTKEDYKTMWKIALAKEDRIEIMEETILAMGDTVDELTAVKKNLEAQLEQKDALIFALQAQSAFFAGGSAAPAPGHSVVHSSATVRETVAGQQAPVTQADQEIDETEEEPMDLVYTQMVR